MDTEQNMAKDVAQVGQDKKNVKGYRQSDKQLAYKKEAVKDVTEFTKSKKDEVQKLKDNFDAKGPIGLRWDSKVPEKDKWLFHFFLLKFQTRKKLLMKYKNI